MREQAAILLASLRVAAAPDGIQGCVSVGTADDLDPALASALKMLSRNYDAACTMLRRAVRQCRNLPRVERGHIAVVFAKSGRAAAHKWCAGKACPDRAARHLLAQFKHLERRPAVQQARARVAHRWRCNLRRAARRPGRAVLASDEPCPRTRAARTVQEQADRDAMQHALERSASDEDGDEEGFDLSALDGDAAPAARVQWNPAEQGDNMLGLLITEEAWRRSTVPRKRPSVSSPLRAQATTDAKRRMTAQWLGPCGRHG